jgi:hypothetical protein
VPDLTAPPRAASTSAARPPQGTRARLLSSLGSTVFRLASAVRGERAIHARGTTVAARLLVPGGARLGVPLFDEPGRHEALVRFSRSVGLPDRLPDILGVAVRVLDAHGPGSPQDLLLDSTLPLPVVRRLPLPRYDFLGATYTSLTQYELGRERHLLALLPDTGAPSTPTVDGLAGRSDGARLRLVAVLGRRSWRELAVLELGSAVPEGRQVRFSPDVTGGGIRPVGWLHDLRRDAYRASHVGPDA